LRKHGADSSDAELAMRIEAELAAQGLTAVIADASALRCAAGLLGAEDPNLREKRLADARRRLADVEIRMPVLEPSQRTGEPT